MHQTNCNCSRRDFLKGATAGAAAFTISPILGLRPAWGAAAGTTLPDNGEFLVVMNLLGGNDGLNTVIPSHRSNYEAERPNINLTDPALGNVPAGRQLHSLDGNYLLHYALGPATGALPSGLKQMWDLGELYVANKVGYDGRANLSHFTSQDVYSFGVRDFGANGDGRGWLGRFADAYCANASDPRSVLGVVAVGVGRRRDFESNGAESLILSNVDTFNVASGEPVDDHELRMRIVRDTMAQEPPPAAEPGISILGSHRNAYDLVDVVEQGISTWQDPNGRYSNNANNILRHLRSVSKMVHADLGTRVYYTGFGGFDTHGTQLTRHETLLTRLNEALNNFRLDMMDRGRWAQCTVVVISEFGRRNFENVSVGTDHGHGSCFFVAGGPVRGGQIVGDIQNAELTRSAGWLGRDIDFREIYSRALERLGADPARIFPEPFTNTGNIQLY
ncbi:MAG: DUF1501 domain-containing protein [Planctomycetota bacterium]